MGPYNQCRVGLLSWRAPENSNADEFTPGCHFPSPYPQLITENDLWSMSVSNASSPSEEIRTQGAILRSRGYCRWCQVPGARNLWLRPYIPPELRKNDWPCLVLPHMASYSSQCLPGELRRQRAQTFEKHNCFIWETSQSVVDPI